tara:strand:+ start:420 stop:1628 length:1209 start_codon:yes stop_codon:yes gene_type:complete
MTLQVRRGTNSERLGITPLQGELIYVTDTKQLFVGDGATAGGTTAVAGTIDSLLADTSPQLGGELDLNGNNITGTGNINITGNITASGNINLGDGAGGDTLVIGGAIQGHMVPDTTVTYNLGANNLYWKEAWISQLNVENQLTVGRIMGDLIADDSTVVFDASTGLVAAAQLTGTLPAGVIPAAMTSNITGNLTGNAAGSHTGTLDGDLTGSVFADDSSIIIDGLNGDGHFSSIISTDAQLNIGRTTGISELRLESFQTRNRFNINTVDKTGDLSSYTGYYGTLNFGFEDATTDRSDCTIRGRASDMRIAHDTVTVLIDDETKYFTLKEGNFGFGTYTPAEKLDVRGNIIATGTIQPGVYADAAARDAALTAPTAGQMVYITDVAKFQGNTDGTITGWANLN